MNGKNRNTITDVAALEKIIDEIVAASPKTGGAIPCGKDYDDRLFCRTGNEGVQGSGQPELVNELLKRSLL